MERLFRTIYVQRYERPLPCAQRGIQRAGRIHGNYHQVNPTRLTNLTSFSSPKCSTPHRGPGVQIDPDAAEVPALHSTTRHDAISYVGPIGGWLHFTSKTIAKLLHAAHLGGYTTCRISVFALPLCPLMSRQLLSVKTWRLGSCMTRSPSAGLQHIPHCLLRKLFRWWRLRFGKVSLGVVMIGNDDAIDDDGLCNVM